MQLGMLTLKQLGRRGFAGNKRAAEHDRHRLNRGREARADAGEAALPTPRGRRLPKPAPHTVAPPLDKSA